MIDRNLPLIDNANVTSGRARMMIDFDPQTGIFDGFLNLTIDDLSIPIPSIFDSETVPETGSDIDSETQSEAESDNCFSELGSELGSEVEAGPEVGPEITRELTPEEPGNLPSSQVATGDSVNESHHQSIMSNMDTPSSSHPDMNRNRLPTLFEVLSRQTLAPVDLFSFYIYMRDQQRSVDYLDFW